MPSDIVMPRLSDTMEEGKLLRWLKHQGDSIHKGDALAEVETDKANMEVEAFEDGILAEILRGEGDSVPVGETIARLSRPGERVDKPAALEKATAEQPIPPKEAAKEAPVEGRPATVKEAGRTMAPESEQVLSFAEKEEGEGEEGPVRATTKTQEELLEKAPPAAQPRKRELEKGEISKEAEVKASPLAKKLADAYGIDLSTLHGSGPEGRIVERDVEQAIQERRFFSAKAKPSEEMAPTLEPLSKMRQTIAQRMTESKQQAPHFYVTVSIQGDRLVEIREKLAQETDPAVTYNHFIIKACAMALRAHPRVNAAYQDGQVAFHPSINIAIAVALENGGLIAPVLHGVDQLSLGEIADRSHDLLKRVRGNALTPEDLTGGTFTLSNMGMYGVEDFSAIINLPQAAILATGTLEQTPVIRDGTVAPGYRMKVTLSADHRVINGAEAAEFLRTFRSFLENPVRMML